MSLLRRPRVWESILSGLLVVAVAAEHLYMSGAGHPQWSGWSAVAGVVGVALAMWLRRRHPAVAVALVCVLVGGTVVANDGWILISYVAFAALVSFLVGRWADRAWPSVAVVGVAVVTLTVLDAAVNGGGVQVAMAGNMIIFMALPWLSGRYLRQVARHHSTEIEQAQLTERARIAQEMHDSLGHELSLIALRAGALEVAPGLSAAHQKAAGDIREAAAGATERLGEIVGVLRPAAEEAPLTPAATGIAGLVERARESGMDVRLVGSLTEGTAPVRDAAAHRIVQEALTNAARHAPGSSVTVSVEEREPDGVRLSVSNGRATLPPRAGATTGLGLAGLDEAARAAGGTLRHGPVQGGGFEVVADLPARADRRSVERREVAR
ncbi:sensor histidine kinase [Nocardioides luteus]|uniref:sensor histidine kinase n=1 Tax=Nocardioides luteus TaxID=1844 RepID=UPI0018C96A93|nr:histidine kinase [Nocardioides luteus]MBG6094830.1 signal transduction histidine kinase [Nocardioides luteus]